MCESDVCYEELPFCRTCLSLIQQLLTETCEKCNRVANSCECDDKNVNFAFYYGSPTSRKLIYFIKNGIDKVAISFVAELAVNACGLKMDSFDGVAFVPRHRRNRLRNGYDQAKEFAKALSRMYNLPFINALERIGGREQKLLSRAERMKNIKGSYRIRKKYNVNEKYNKILLVDDIYTTGATMKVCADLLRGNVAHAVVPLTYGKTKNLYKGSKK